MKRVEAPCPACGAPVEFRVSSSLVAVCKQCGSLTARGDRKLEDQGKSAALVETKSPLALGVTGTFGGKSFELVGRSQYRHASGAVWDEWYAAFSNERWGWLAEAQGRFMLTFPRALSAESTLTPHHELRPGMSIALSDKGSYVVSDLGPSVRIAAAGELPFVPHLNAPHVFADLEGPEGRFASLDYDDSRPKLFIGKHVKLADLGISPMVDADHVKEVSAVLIDCPNCGGSLETHAPDRVERIICPYCQGIIDTEQGKYRYLRSLQVPLVRPLIPLGRVGTLRGVSYTVIGFMQRAVTIDGQDYFWTEYLLYGADTTFRWLVNSDGHWSFVEPVSVGDVQLRPNFATYQGRSFKIFQRAIARVTYVLGEFTWKVEVGEQVEGSDYIAPPLALSVEISSTTTAPTPDESPASDERGDRIPPAGGAPAAEVNMSLATYVPHAELEQAFELKTLPRGWTIAPNQPNPIDGRVYGLWVAFVIVVVILDLVISAVRGASNVDHGWLVAAVVLVSAVPVLSWLASKGYEKSRWQESMYGPDE